MSMQIDYAEISRQARRIVDANRAKNVADQLAQKENRPRKRVKYSRSTNGCFGCRQQKVKCDETLPTCLRCIASQRECRFPETNNKVSSRSSAPSSETEGHTSSGLPPTTAAELDATAAHQAIRPEAPGADGSSFALDLDSLLGSVVPDGNVDGVLPGNEWVNWDFSLQPVTTNQPTQLLGPDLPLPIDAMTPNTQLLNDWLTFTSPPAIPPISFSPDTILPPATIANQQIITNAETSPPQFHNLGKSLLLNRRSAIKSDSVVTAQQSVGDYNSTTIHSKKAMSEAILDAFAFDNTFIEFGPSHRKGAPVVKNAHTDILSTAFPSPTSRLLFHHYCNVTSRLLITMGNIGPNPLLTLCTPLTLLDTASATSAAIRMSILSISTAHFAHDIPSSEIAASTSISDFNWLTTCSSLETVSGRFKKAALSNITLATGKSVGPGQIDSILAACTLLCIRDVISGDASWEENLEFAMKFVNKQGGPQALLAGQDYSFTRRYFLENLAVHDVFGCFITGKEPVFLGNFDRWWFESVDRSKTRWEWESVEQTFGISRAMVDLVARVATLDSRKRRLGIVINSPNQQMIDLCQHFVAESHTLLLEADLWGVSLSSLPQNVRVTCGDYIYKHMIVLFVLADILEQPSSTPRIAKSVDCILELCSEATVMRMTVMLVWPLLIAGVFALPEIRPKVISLFEAFQGDYFEDLVIARKCLEEQWRLIDTGKGKQSWSKVMRSLNKFALLV